MSENVINLREVRKQRARALREEEAAANRAKYGRSRAEKEAQQTDQERRERQLDGAQIDASHPDVD